MVFSITRLIIILATCLVLVVAAGVENIMLEKIARLRQYVHKTVLVHVDIPQCGGPALSSALTASCKCTPTSATTACTACKTVQGSARRSVPYSISGNTGWDLGKHAPFDVLRKHPILEDFEGNGLYPVYIIVLRRPFDRFLSEVSVWGPQGHGVDWSVAINLSHSNSNGQLYPGLTTSNFSTSKIGSGLPAYVKTYASLPGSFMFHNRHTKMIGGKHQNFNMSFDPQTSIGSRWQTSTGAGINAALENAVDILGTHMNVVFGFEERLPELLCVLEMIYGQTYRFKWNTHAHSHNSTHKVKMQEDREEKKAEMYHEAYEEWVKRNGADKRLYTHAETLFDAHFKVALDNLKSLIRRDNGMQQWLPRVPHCQAFLYDDPTPKSPPHPPPAHSHHQSQQHHHHHHDKLASDHTSHREGANFGSHTIFGIG